MSDSMRVNSESISRIGLILETTRGSPITKISASSVVDGLLTWAIDFLIPCEHSAN
jgi:hypothetical protein